jgi:hypothetical protein
VLQRTEWILPRPFLYIHLFFQNKTDDSCPRPPYYLHAHFDIILQCTPTPSNWFYPSELLCKNFVCNSHLPVRATRPTTYLICLHTISESLNAFCFLHPLYFLHYAQIFSSAKHSQTPPIKAPTLRCGHTNRLWETVTNWKKTTTVTNKCYQEIPNTGNTGRQITCESLNVIKWCTIW